MVTTVKQEKLKVTWQEITTINSINELKEELKLKNLDTSSLKELENPLQFTIQEINELQANILWTDTEKLNKLKKIISEKIETQVISWKERQELNENIQRNEKNIQKIAPEITRIAWIWWITTTAWLVKEKSSYLEKIVSFFKNISNKIESFFESIYSKFASFFGIEEKNNWDWNENYFTETQNFIKKNWDKEFVVDFSNKKWAEYNIWLSDLLSEEITQVRVTWEKNWKKYDMTGKRQWLKWWFYTESWDYIPIFNWFKIEVLQSYTENELNTKKQENEKKIKEITDSPWIQDFKKRYDDKQLITIVTKAQEYNIDPTFLLALRTAENGKEWFDFWIMKRWINTFEWQLIMACRTIQNNMNRFKKTTWQEAMSTDWRLTINFISFFSSIYAPIWVNNDPQNLNQNHFTNLVNLYSQYSNINFGNQNTIMTQYNNLNKQYAAQINSLKLLSSTKPDILISTATSYLWTKYVWWWDNEKWIDCSWLVIKCMQELWIINYTDDTTAAWLFKVTQQKNPNNTKKWDLVFLKQKWKINHVQIALWPAKNWKIPVIDASSSIGKVSNRYQAISSEVLVWTPVFYI